MTAILIGDRGGLDQDDERRLQEAGTYHVIAISGGNIALLTAMLVVLGRVARLPVADDVCSVDRAAARSTATRPVWRPRSCARRLRAAFTCLPRVIDHRGSAMNALAVAAGTAAASTPLSVLDPGFVLSFGATFAIVGAASRLIAPVRTQRAETRARAVARAVALAAAGLGGATLCAEVALLPVGARLFGRVSFAGLVLNFAAVPLMSLIQVAGLAAVAVHPVSRPASAGCGWIAHVGTIALLGSARLVDIWPWLVIDVPPPPMWVIASVVRVGRCARGVVETAADPKRRARGDCGGGRADRRGPRLDCAPVEQRNRPRAGRRLAFLDVGQGDATLLMPAGGPSMLVDAGGAPGSSFDLGRRVTLPALWALGVSRLGILALTHGDPDHIGGAAAVVRALTPGEIWEGVPVPGHQATAGVRRAAADRGVTWTSVRTGDTQLAGAARIRVLNPPAARLGAPEGPQRRLDRARGARSATSP